MYEEREISIKNMLINALLKWRMIIAVALVFAVAIPLAKYAMDQKKVQQAAERVIVAQDVEDANVGALADLYAQYNSLNEQLNQYSKAGIDPACVKYAYIQYYIAPSEVASGTDVTDTLLLKMAERMNTSEDDLANLYRNYLLSDEFVRPLMESVGIEQENMFRQFLNVTAVGHNVRILMPYTEAVDVDLMISTAENLVSGKVKDFQIAGEHELKTISSGRTEEKKAELITEQYTLTYERYNINRWMVQVQNEMTEDQIAYAKQIAEGNIAEGDDLPVSMLSVGDEEQEVSIQIKYVIIGAFLGFFLMLVWYSARYAMSGKLDAPETMTALAKLRVFETVELPRKKRICHGIDDKLLYLLHSNKRKLTQEQQIAAIVSAISLYAEQNNLKKLCLTSTRYGKLSEDVVDGITKALAGEHLDVTVVDDVAYDKTALRACVAADGVVLVEQVGRSVLSEIEKLLKSANEYKINVIGSIVLE